LTFFLYLFPCGISTEASEASQFAKVYMIRERKPWLSNWVELWKSDVLGNLPEKAEKPK